MYFVLHLARATTSRGEMSSPCDRTDGDERTHCRSALGGAKDGRRLVESVGRAPGERERAHLAREASERDG